MNGFDPDAAEIETRYRKHIDACDDKIKRLTFLTKQVKKEKREFAMERDQLINSLNTDKVGRNGTVMEENPGGGSIKVEGVKKERINVETDEVDRNDFLLDESQEIRLATILINKAKKWAEEERQTGKVIRYWDILGNQQVKDIVRNVRTTNKDLNYRVPLNTQKKYGQKIINTINNFLKSEGVKSEGITSLFSI